MTIAAGQLDRRIAFQGQVVGNDDFNEPNGDWSDICIRWARVRPAPGYEKFASAEMVAASPTLFLVRFDSATSRIGVEDRILYDGAIYNIRWRNEVGRREGIEFLAERDS